MTIEAVIYLIDVSGSVKDTIFTLSFFFFVLLGGSLFFGGIESDMGLTKKYTKTYSFGFFCKLKKYIALPIIAILIASFIPSQKTMYLMLGANYLKNSALPTKVEIAIEKKIDEYLIEAPKKK